MYIEILSAFTLGLIIGSIPGPSLTVVFTEILQTNYKKSFRVIFWIMLAITIVALISLSIFSIFDPPNIIFQLISLIGAGILFWIAMSMWKIKSFDLSEKIHFSSLKLFGITICNGILWTFWITVCVPKALLMDVEMHFGKYIFLFFIELGLLLPMIIFGFIFSYFRSMLTKPDIFKVVFKFFSLVFSYFSLDMLYKSLVFFIN